MKRTCIGLVFLGLLMPMLAAQRPSFVEDTTYVEAKVLLAAAQPIADVPSFQSAAAAYGTLLLRSKKVELRQQAFDSLSHICARAVHLSDFSTASMEGVTGVKALQLADSPYRFLTWQLFVNDSTYRYGGVLHDYQAGTSVRLEDAAQASALAREYELFADQWYGALYYGARAFTLKSGRPAWLLFGYDADGFYHRRKVADVLTFDRKGRPRFGAEVFRGAEGRPGYTFSRLILEYRVDARVGLNYDEALGGIAFDRLVTGPPVMKGGPPSRIPDGSYDGYVLDEKAGVWRYREEWFDRVISKEAPRPAPVLGERREGRDLFGRAKADKGP